jgi:hypothetical protein
VLLLADPERRLTPADVRPFAEASIASGCCWFEIWGPTAHALEDAVDAVREAIERGCAPSDDEEDHVVMTASSTPEEAGLADAVRMVLCATCSTEGHTEEVTSRLFVVASGDEPFAERLLGWLRAPATLP